MTAPSIKVLAEQAFEKMCESQERYREAREKLIATHDQIIRNQKSLVAARQEADSLNREWKELLRSNDGEATKAVREKLEASRNARDIVQELEPILSAGPEILEEAEALAITARKTYIKDREDYMGAMLAMDLEEKIEAVKDVPEFQRFTLSLGQYLSYHQSHHRKDVRLSIMGNPEAKEGAMSADDLKKLEQDTKGRVLAQLYRVMESVGLNESQEVITGDEEIPESPQEKASPLKHSTIRLMQVSKRMKATA